MVSYNSPRKPPINIGGPELLTGQPDRLPRCSPLVSCFYPCLAFWLFWFVAYKSVVLPAAVPRSLGLEIIYSYIGDS
jgi:hypothetical protein